MSISWRNPVYNATGDIDCEIQHPILGWIPFTARVGDTSFFDVNALITEITVAGGIAPYVPPAPPTTQQLRAQMKPLSRRQVFIMLAEEGFLTDLEAEEAAAGNLIPTSIEATLNALQAAGQMTANQKRAARITFLSFTHAYRTDPMVPIIVSSTANTPDDATLDAWWQTYVAI